MEHMKKYLVYGDEVYAIRTTCLKILRILHSLEARIESYSEISQEDFSSVVIFNDRRIAIYSAGSASSELREALSFADNNNCDVLITTVRKGIHYNTVLPDPETDKEREWREFDTTVDNPENELKRQNEIAWNVICNLMVCNANQCSDCTLWSNT